MKYSLKILNIDTGYSQASESHFLDVEVEVFDGEESIGVRKFGFPLGTSKEEIVKSLEKVKATLDSDQEVAVASAELKAGLDNATALKEELNELTI